jgi:hypothetical protein
MANIIIIIIIIILYHIKNEYKNINSIVYWMEVSINLFFPLIYFAPPPKVKSWIYRNLWGELNLANFKLGVVRAYINILLR